MADEAERIKPAPRTGAAGWGDQVPEPDVKAIVDRVMDPYGDLADIAEGRKPDAE